MKHSKRYSFVFIIYLLSIVPPSFAAYKFDLQFAQHVLGSGYISEAFFVPNDKVKKLLLSLIDNERSSILLAQYRITDIDIAKALCAARQRGVLIRCITDQSCADEQYNKLAALQKSKVPIALYQRSGIMHNKFYIFGNNISHKPLLWTGSANGSRAGTTRNQENVVVTENRKLIKQFREKFISLWHEIQKGKKDLPVTQKQVLSVFLVRTMHRK
jgi:phosphatidylserine/phosphatidylglycerophosphate/cardiolipin synthase-like enzyme